MKRGLLYLVIVSLFVASLFWYAKALKSLYRAISYNPWSANRDFMYDYSPGEEWQHFFLWTIFGSCFLAAAILSYTFRKTS